MKIALNLKQQQGYFVSIEIHDSKITLLPMLHQKN